MIRRLLSHWHVPGLVLLIAAMILGPAIYLGETRGYAAEPEVRTPAPYTMPDGMVHCVLEFERDSDLEHYAAWVLDEVGVSDSDAPSRYPNGWEMTELDMIWLYTSQEECQNAKALTGTGPLLNVEAAQTVSLPEPVEGGGPLSAPGQSGRQITPTGVQRIGTPDWSDTRAPSMAGVKVAVVDTGTDGTHDDLPRLAGGFNCSQDERGVEGWDIDAHGHSTHLSGTIGAEDDDDYVVGIAPSVDMDSIVVFGPSGSASGAMVLCGLNKALELGADIANFSLGGGHIATRCGGASPYTNAYCKAIAQGMIVVAAAGNHGQDAIIAAPANIEGVLTVGAIVDFDGLPGGQGLGFPGCGLGHRDDHLASFSAWGSSVDVVAPGGCILSTAPLQSWAFSSGTSMATPHVVGVLANFMARYTGCRGQNAVDAVLVYAERPEWAEGDGRYDGWFGADAPPLVRYVLPDQPVLGEDDNPCRIPGGVYDG